MFSATSLHALLSGEGVESLEGSTRAFFNFLLPFLLYSGSLFPPKASALACCSYCTLGIGSLIIIPLSPSLKGLLVGLAGAATFIGLPAVTSLFFLMYRSINFELFHLGGVRISQAVLYHNDPHT